MNIDCTAQLTFVLGGFLGEDVALERLAALDGSTWAHAKTLLRAALGLHFRHNTICPLDSSVFLMIAGGNNYVALGCLLSLIGSSIEATAFCWLQGSHPLQPAKFYFYKAYFFFLGASTIII
jgi:hypothetical protein